MGNATWSRLALKLRTADLIASDRHACGRDQGHVATMRSHYDAGLRQLLAGLKSINRLLDALTN